VRSNQASARLENVGLMPHNVHDTLRWNLCCGHDAVADVLPPYRLGLVSKAPSKDLPLDDLQRHWYGRPGAGASTKYQTNGSGWPEIRAQQTDNRLADPPYLRRSVASSRTTQTAATWLIFGVGRVVSLVQVGLAGWPDSCHPGLASAADPGQPAQPLRRGGPSYPGHSMGSRRQPTAGPLAAERRVQAERPSTTAALVPLKRSVPSCRRGSSQTRDRRDVGEVRNGASEQCGRRPEARVCHRRKACRRWRVEVAVAERKQGGRRSDRGPAHCACVPG
jgi:hypothetical protein